MFCFTVLNRRSFLKQGVLKVMHAAQLKKKKKDALKDFKPFEPVSNFFVCFFYFYFFFPKRTFQRKKSEVVQSKINSALNRTTCRHHASLGMDSFLSPCLLLINIAVNIRNVKGPGQEDNVAADWSFRLPSLRSGLAAQLGNTG